jgi:phosphate uptake regulator
LERAHGEIRKAVEGTTTALVRGADELTKELKRTVDQMAAEMKSVQAEVSRQLGEAIKDSHGRAISSISDGQRVLAESVLKLDKALEAEIRTALDSMGRQLASISEKFARDYTPLADGLRNVMTIVEHARGAANGS